MNIILYKLNTLLGKIQKRDLERISRFIFEL